MTLRVDPRVVAVALLALTGCGATGPSASGCNNVETTQAAATATGGDIDLAGVYTGDVGGKPGFMVIDRTESADPWIRTLLMQRGRDVSGFGGAGKAPQQREISFPGGLPNGGGQFYESGLLTPPNSGAAILAIDWTVDTKMTGAARPLSSAAAPLDYDLTFDPVSLGPQPAGNAIPAGEYDIIHDGADIGDFSVASAGSGTGSVTWPGAQQDCAIGVSSGVRAPQTTRNIWRVQFNSELACSPPVWSTGYAIVSSGGAVSFELIASRQSAVHGRPAPANEKDLMHIQLKCRS